MDNCWEVQQCGREPGGVNADSLGICEAAVSRVYDGVNEGQFGGRFCWAIAGTLCGGQVQGTMAQKVTNCMLCPFYAQVVAEQGRSLTLNPQQLD